jgi:hypothetical protein
MLANRTFAPKPIQSKDKVAQIAHVSAPLKGLNLSSRLTTGDPLTAPILTNMVVLEDRVSTRAGYRKVSTHADHMPIQHFLPWYGPNPRLAAGTNRKIIDALTGEDIRTGFTSDDWHWTSFANLGTAKYTIMVNGADGVWSWDGGERDDSAPVTVTSLSNANPAVVTVASTDIGQFHNGDTVIIAGADSQHVEANGAHLIGNVGTPANTFQLLGVDLSSANSGQTSGVTAVIAGSFIHEPITAPAAQSWVTPDLFQLVLAHMNRLWFADSTNLAVYYLPLQSKSGEVKVLPLNALFRAGGSIKALATWTLAGISLNDQLVVFTTNGECAVFIGTDPDSDWQLAGIYRFNAPMSHESTVNYGGDLYCMIPTGVAPLTTLMASEGDSLSNYDKAVVTEFLSRSQQWRDRDGWQLIMNPNTGRLICNMPGAGISNYKQMVRHMPQPLWSSFQDVPSRCWAWVDPYLYFGDDEGNVYQMHPDYRSDDGRPITVDVMSAWSQFKWPGVKAFKMVHAYIVTDGRPMPFLDVKVKYDYSPAVNQPEVSFSDTGADWDVSDWDEADWAGGTLRPWCVWTGVGSQGHVGAVRLTARVLDCVFEVNGFDVTFEQGRVFG